MEHYLMISDAAKEVCVESHVLRYWEEELKLPIKRNELGHRYYTRADVECFKQIKRMKEKGLQLKAIKLFLKDESVKDNILSEKSTVERELAEEKQTVPRIEIISCREFSDEQKASVAELSKEDKAKRLQWLLRQLIRETLQENNDTLCNEIRNSVVKELDYQFRSLEEREEEREMQRINRDEMYYKKMDELLRKKSGRDILSRKNEKTDINKADCSKEVLQKTDRRAGDRGTELHFAEKKGKKKRHSIF